MNYSIKYWLQQAESFLLTKPAIAGIAAMGINYGFGFHHCIGIICTILYIGIFFEDRTMPSSVNVKHYYD